MSSENPSRTKEQVREQLKALENLLGMWESQQTQLEGSRRAHAKYNPTFFGYGIAESVELDESIRRVKLQIEELKKEL